MYSCYCGRRLYSESALHQHQVDKRHGYCYPCNLVFQTEVGFEMHRQALHNWRCSDCGSVHASEQALLQHQRDKGHLNYCADCDQYFNTAAAVQQHLESPRHVSEYRCCDCDRSFGSSKALDDHLRDKVHPDVEPIISNTTCRECDREFATEHGLQQHLSSVIHNPLSNIKCIGSQTSNCRRMFTSPSAMIFHLESGACPSRVTKKMLDRVIQKHDVKGIISNPSTITQALGNGSPDGTESASESGVLISLTPSTSNASSAFSSPQALTPISDDDNGVLLPMLNNLCLGRTCLICSKSFRTEWALQQHVASPVHSPRLYHCPDFLTAEVSIAEQKTDIVTVSKSFKTLSGLAQHLESGACDGGMEMLYKAAAYIEERLRDLGMKNVKLLL